MVSMLALSKRLLTRAKAFSSLPSSSCNGETVGLFAPDVFRSSTTTLSGDRTETFICLSEFLLLSSCYCSSHSLPSFRFTLEPLRYRLNTHSSPVVGQCFSLFGTNAESGLFETDQTHGLLESHGRKRKTDRIFVSSVEFQQNKSSFAAAAVAYVTFKI